MGKYKRKQADHQADTRGQGWIGLPRAVADSAAYVSLNPFERAVFEEILRRFNGFNNCEIRISYEEIGDRIKGPNACRPNNRRIALAIVALIQRGLIAEPTPESWMQRKARTYRLTFITSGKAPPFQRATNEYLSWQLEEKIDGDAPSPDEGQSGDDQSPRIHRFGDGRSRSDAKNGSFALVDGQRPGDPRSLLIVKPYPVPGNGAETSCNFDPSIADGPIAKAAHG